MKNKLSTLAAALTLAAVLGSIYAAPALAQVIKAALVQNVDEPGRQPYQFTYSGASSLLGAASTPVAAGKRLVLQYATTSQLVDLNVAATNALVAIRNRDGSNAGPVFLLTNISGAVPNSVVYSGPLMGYLDEGQYLIVFPGRGIVSGTITGYLINCTSNTPCTPINQDNRIPPG